MATKAHVTLYSKPGCHLCEEAMDAIRAAACDDQFTLEEINIETDAGLFERYRYDIPVISINGVETFMHRVDPSEFRVKILSTDYTGQEQEQQAGAGRRLAQINAEQKQRKKPHR